MAQHVWRIKKEYFHQLQSGEKTLEIRVGYAPIRKLQKGDTIVFDNYGPNEFLVKRVTTYRSLKEMLSHERASQILPGVAQKDVLPTLQRIYPRDREVLGVYAIELQSTTNQRPAKEFFRASDLLKSGQNKRFSRVIAEAYIATDWITSDYPTHVDDFYSKYVPGLFNGTREIITCYIGGKIAGVAILKKDTEERKISTLYVRPDYQHRGIATELLTRSFNWLGTTRPLITIADYKLGQFKKIIEKYQWTETQVLEQFYNDHSSEHVFNGVIK